MITEDYVSFEVAELLKEKGFDEYCFALYNPSEELIQCGVRLNNTQVGRVKDSYSAPTLQMAMKWLREVHNKHIYVIPAVTDDDGVMGYWWEDYIITNKRYDSIKTGKLYESPEEAAEAAIKYCLTNLI